MVRENASNRLNTHPNQTLRSAQTLVGNGDAYRLLLEQSPIAHLITDMDGKIVYANGAFFGLLGYEQPDLARLTLYDFVAEDEHERSQVLEDDWRDDGRFVIRVEGALRCKDGSLLEARTTVYPVYDGKRHVFNVLSIEDVSGSRYRKSVLQTAAHDLKNPLTNLISASGMMNEVIVGNREAELFMNAIQQSVTRMREIIIDVLEQAAYAESSSVKFQDMDLNTFLAELVDEFAYNAREKGVQLDFQPLEPPVILPIDPGLMNQAIANLLSNALKYTGPGGSVSISGLVTADEAIIEVRDTGLGIPQTELPHLFDRFYRVNTDAHRAVEGTGLGLSIIKTIAEQHEGRVWVESQMGHGSTFYLALPLEHLDE